MQLTRNTQSWSLTFKLLFTGLFLAHGNWVSAQTDLVRLVIAFPPGGSSDILARAVADQLSKETNQKVVVENRPGGNGAVAAQFVLNAPADGKTLWLTTSGAASINPVLYPKLSYSMANFAPVTLVANTPELLVVNSKNPAADAKQFVQNATSQKTGNNIVSSGIGSLPHMAIALFSDATKVPFTHIPSKGAAPAITDVMGGHVDGFFGDISGVISHIKAGKLKALGIGATKRHPLLPEVKTFEEMGYKGVELNNWSAVFVTKGVPAPVVNELNRGLRKVIDAPSMRAKLEQSGIELQASSPEELAALVQTDLTRWKHIIVTHDIKPE
jgi:tripartite-type tricarboxylate transporter receptor subunit TctC